MKATSNEYQKSKIKIVLKNLFAIATLSLFIFSCNKDDNTIPTPILEQPAPFNINNFSEYLTCKVGDFQYNTGNSTGNTASIDAFQIGSTLYLTASDGNFVSGSTPSMEMNFQFKNFDSLIPKGYEVSGTYPTEILKFKHIDGDNYDTNNGINTTPQLNAITITKIENGFYFGTFNFTTYKIVNRSSTLQVTQGNFKFKL